MKKFRKLTAMVSALALAGCMLTSFSAIQASADDTGYSITISADSTDTTTHQYVAYQVFSGTYDSDKDELSSIDWGSAIASGAKTSALEAVKAIKLTDGTKPFGDCDTPADIADVLGGYADNADPVKAFAAAIGTYATASPTEISGDNTNGYTASMTSAGYYLVKDTAGSLNGTASEGTAFILEVLGNADNVAPKIGTPTVVKKVKENAAYTDNEGYGTGYNDVADYSTFDDISFELIGTLPDNYDDYENYYYEFNDTLDTMFNIKENSIHVYLVNDASDNLDDLTNDITELFKTTEVKVDSATKTKSFSIYSSNLKGYEDTNITKDSRIVVRYTAQLNTDAYIGQPGQVNDVYLRYSNNPTNSGKGDITPSDVDKSQTKDEEGNTNNTDKIDVGKTPEDKVIVFTYAIELTKYKDKATTNNLVTDDTVGFKLLSSDKKKVAEVDAAGFFLQWIDISDESDLDTKGTELNPNANGKVIVKGLDEGTYILRETKVPTPYNAAADQKVVIDATTENGQKWEDMQPTSALTAFTYTINSGTAFTEDSDIDGTAKLDVINKKGTTLPSTGGIGTTIFYLSGGILVVGAGVSLIAKKRMKDAE